MSCNEVILRVNNISKCFEMYGKPSHRLYQTLTMGRRKFFKEFWALKDISFELKRGQCLGIIGRNGCGKSTLLQLIAGTLAPTCGSVEVNGKVAALLELGSGFNPEFSGRENIYMNATVLGLSRKEIDYKLQSIIDFADIGDFIDQPVKTYSSGMYVRLAFAIVTHVEADILIIDEALAVGDAFFVQKCMAFLQRFIEEKTVILVSHDTGAVMNLCDHAIFLDHGQIEYAGRPKEVTEKYLESIYETRQGASFKVKTAPKKKQEQTERHLSTGKDMRHDWLNSSNLRNDLECFKFDDNSSGFGKGKAEIINVELRDENGNKLLWIVGGEKVSLKIQCRALYEIKNPIMGFYLRDTLGQDIFGDNTYFTHIDQEFKVPAGCIVTAEFEFTMPRLPVGEYYINSAIAEGTLEEHVQHHWMHNALIIKSHTSSVCQGLVGLPMENIRMYIND